MVRKSSVPAAVKRPRRDDVRRHVLDAALAEFTRHGYERASLDRIATTAGFSKGAIYSNFAGKEDLFLSLMDQQVHERLDRIAKAVTSAGTAARQDVVAGHVGRVLTDVIASDTAWQLLFLDYVTHAARDPTRHAQLTERRRKIRAVVADATLHMLGPDHPLWTRFTPDAIAITMLAISNGLALERIADPDGIADDLLGHIMQALLQPQAPTGSRVDDPTDHVRLRRFGVQCGDDVVADVAGVAVPVSWSSPFVAPAGPSARTRSDEAPSSARRSASSARTSARCSSRQHVEHEMPATSTAAWMLLRKTMAATT